MNRLNVVRDNLRLAAIGAAAFLGLVGAALTNGAQAATPSDEIAKVVVEYGDLNLTTAPGTTALHRRIAAAARQVCLSADSRDLRTFTASRTCQDTAIARALDQVRDAHFAAAAMANTRP